MFKEYEARRDFGMLIPIEVEKLRVEFLRTLCKWYLENIIISNEAAVSFRSFPSRTIFFQDQPAAHKRDEDRIRAVLSVTADGKNYAFDHHSKIKTTQVVF